MSKSAALVAGLALIALFGILSFILPDRAGPLGSILTAVETIVIAYFGMRTVNNGVKGKFFNQALYDAGHQQTEGEQNDDTKH
jgi:hypothetical protein